MKNKNPIIGIILVVALFFSLSFVVGAAYSRTNVAYAQTTSAQYLSQQGVSLYNFDPDKCEAGQDFIVQVAPFGCEPAVVRSDLLEEQDVPVFCQLSATKINPLVDVNAVDSVTFKGAYPEEIKTVAFHPANAALGSNSRTILNSPIFGNIGYAVVVLKKQQNESSMPNKVSGNLTVTLKYNLEKAFGIGKATYYLPVIDDSKWLDEKNSYSFWQGRGFLKAEQVDNNGATISIYKTDQNKLSTVNLQPGEISRNIYMPGFYCRAGLQVRLDGLQNPQPRAKFSVDGDTIEVVRGEKFLGSVDQTLGGGDCRVDSIKKEGVVQKVGVTCKGDNGITSLGLNINPRIMLNINNQGLAAYSVGDYLFEYTGSHGTKYVYLAYIGNKGGAQNPKNLYIYLLAIPTKVDRLSESDLSLIASEAGKENAGPVSSSSTVNSLASGLVKSLSLSQHFSAYLVKGTQTEKLMGLEQRPVFDSKTNVQLAGFSGTEDYSLSPIQTKNNFDKSIADYKRIINNFGNEKSDGQTETYGERAFRDAIVLSTSMRQMKTAALLCDEFQQKYPQSNVKLDEVCGDALTLANKDVASAEVLINSETHHITFQGVIEPTWDEAGVELTVTKKGQSPQIYYLAKDLAVVLGADAGNEIFRVGSLSTPIYFAFSNGKWLVSSDYKTVQGVLTNVYSYGTAAYVQEKVLVPSYRNDVAGMNFEQGKAYLEKLDAEVQYVGQDYAKLVDINDRDVNDLNDDYATFEISARRTSSSEGLNSVPSVSRNNLVINTADSFQSEYTFRLERINLKKVAKVTILPNIQQTGSEANMSFNIGIEKRAIQLSPGQIKDRIKILDGQIKTWTSISENLGKVVKGFKVACLSVGTALTVKNFFTNLDGKSIARSDVMRGSGGWMQTCQEAVSQGVRSSLGKEYSSIDACLLDNNDAIEKDVEIQAAIIEEYNNNPLKQETLKEEDLQNIFNGLDASDKQNADLKAVFTLNGAKDGKISLSQARDLQRWNSVLQNGEASEVLKNVANAKRNSIVGSITKFSKDFGEQSALANALKISPSEISSFGDKKITKGIYHGKMACQFVPDTCGTKFDLPVEVVRDLTGSNKYLVFLDGSLGTKDLPVKKSENKDSASIPLKKIYEIKSDGTIDTTIASDVPDYIKNSHYVSYDQTSYKNQIAQFDRTLRYFETDPYKGMPALLPFDVQNGWYVRMSQTLPVLGAIRTYDESGAISSFYLCNVGQNQRIESDDACMQFNLGTGEIYGNFPGLEKSESDKIVQKAVLSIKEAQQKYSEIVRSGRKTVTINGNELKVGEPATNTPELQCQDFMSPRDCWVMFNACDPVVCPASRCNLGGAYQTTNVIASGIVGSSVLCLPNYKEGIVVPVCLSGVKAGTDNLVSMFQDYRDCLKTNLETGQTVGVCDELHSIYMCEFFWKQALPFSKLAIPSLLQTIQGQGNRGGGEYLSVNDAWTNAEGSIDYLTQYYGASSYKAFKSRLTDQVETAVCKSFVSASFPATSDFFNALIEPDSPTQFQASFSESVLTTATFPPTSTYKVFYHIYAGKDSGAYYNVYLKSPAESSFYNSIPYVPVASGYIPRGQYASQTKDFTAETGYKELCVQVNDNAPECGFRQATTSFALNELNDYYIKDVATQEVTTEKDCSGGKPSLYSALNLNVQQSAEELIDPQIYEHGIVRVCATDNPGISADPLRWKEVGYCGDVNMKCWLDQQSVKNVIKNLNIEKQTLGDSQSQLRKLFAEGGYFDDGQFKENLDKLKSYTPETIVVQVTENMIQKSFYSWQKAELLSLRGNAFGFLAKLTYTPPKPEIPSPQEAATTGRCISPSGLGAGQCADSGGKILSVAKQFYDQEYNENRIPSDVIGANEKVCARFATHVLINAGVQGIDLQENLCGWDSNQYLIQNLPSMGFTDIFDKYSSFELKPGDLVLFDKVGQNTDHAVIFSNYDTIDKNRIWGYGEPGVSGPVNFVSYPIDNRANVYGDHSGWYVYHVFRYNQDDLDLSGCQSPDLSLGCESCNSGCTEAMCKAINSNCIFASVLSSSSPETTTPTTTESSVNALCYYYSRDLTKEGAAYMVGNLMQESGLNPNAVEKGGTGNGRGLAQWDVRDRWQTFLKWADKNGLNENDFYTQLQYTLSEDHPASNELNLALRASDIEQIKSAIYQYEKWGEVGNRWTYSEQILSNINSGEYPSNSVDCANQNLQFFKKQNGESCKLSEGWLWEDNSALSIECLSRWCEDIPGSIGGKCGDNPGLKSVSITDSSSSTSATVPDSTTTTTIPPEESQGSAETESSPEFLSPVFEFKTGALTLGSNLFFVYTTSGWMWSLDKNGPWSNKDYENNFFRADWKYSKDLVEQLKGKDYTEGLDVLIHFINENYKDGPRLVVSGELTEKTYFPLVGGLEGQISSLDVKDDSGKWAARFYFNFTERKWSYQIISGSVPKTLMQELENKDFIDGAKMLFEWSSLSSSERAFSR